MAKEIYRYAFVPDIDIDEVEASLVLAIFATESLHGESQTRLDAAHYFDNVMRKCVIDSSTAVGRDLNKLTPVIERVEMPPNMLGMGFRSYLDVGMNSQDSRAAVKVNGE